MYNYTYFMMAADTGTDMVDLLLKQWHREQPGLDTRPMGVIGRVSRAAMLLERRLTPVFSKHHINSGKFDILATLMRAGAPHELTVGRLLGYSMVTSGAIANRLNHLEKEGLIHRRIDPEDRRGVLVKLTTAGKSLTNVALDSHLDNERTLLSSLTEEERNLLARLLRRLLIGLGDTPDEHGLT